ncbi:hypothetical protein RB653_010011 [Dictyostelium firmibasis]|uniref:Uncharacterized protein n=1 Tax=Dictyostelium firmibasis TaxID=79012 RepID=A0AAN7U0D4_9MYCE
MKNKLKVKKEIKVPKKLPNIKRTVPPKLEKYIEEFLIQNEIYLNYYHSLGGINCSKEILFTPELLLLKQTDAAKVLSITVKSLSKLLKYAVKEIEGLSEFCIGKRRILWPHRILDSPVMLYASANKGISVKCTITNNTKTREKKIKQ